MAEEAKRYVSDYTGQRIDSSVGRAPQVVDITNVDLSDFIPGTVLIDKTTYAIYITIGEEQSTQSNKVHLLMAGVQNIDGAMGNVLAYSPTDSSQEVTADDAVKYIQVALPNDDQSESTEPTESTTTTFQIPTVFLEEEIVNGSGTGNYTLKIDFFSSNN